MSAHFSKPREVVRSALRVLYTDDDMCDSLCSAIEEFFFEGLLCYDEANVDEVAQLFEEVARLIYDMVRRVDHIYAGLLIQMLLAAFQDSAFDFSDLIAFRRQYIRFFEQYHTWVIRRKRNHDEPMFFIGMYDDEYDECAAFDFEVCQPQAGGRKSRAEKEAVQREAAERKAKQQKKDAWTPVSKKVVDLVRAAKRDYKFRAMFEEADEQGFGSLLGGNCTGLLDEARLTLERLQLAADDIVNNKPFAKIAKAADATNGVMSAMSNVMLKLQSIIQQIYDTIKQWVPAGTAVCLALALLYWSMSRTKTSAVILMSVGFCASAVFGSSLWDAVRDFFFERAAFFKKDVHSHECDIADEQGGPAVVDLLPRLVTTAFVVHSFGADKKWMVDKLSKRLADAPRTAAGLQDVCGWVVEAVKTIIQNACQFFGHPGFKCLERSETNVEGILRRVHKLYQSHLIDPTGEPHSRFAEMSACLRELFEIKRLYHGVRDVEQRLSEATRMLAIVQGPIRASAALKSGFRPEPVSFCLQGEPGVGKTTMFQWMITAIMSMAKIIGPGTSSEDAAKMIFSKAWNTSYWEGYFDQPVVAMDDFGLAKVSAGEETNCYLDLATIIGPVKTMVNTAACENKGMYSMNAKLVAMTSNVKDMEGVTGNAIEAPMAIIRRIHFPYEVVVKPAYAQENGRLDFDKFKQERARMLEKGGNSFFGQFPWHIWDFYLYNFKGGQRIGGPISAQELMCRIVSRMKRNEVIHHDNVGLMDEMLKCTPPDPDEYLATLEACSEQSGCGTSEFSAFEDTLQVMRLRLGKKEQPGHQWLGERPEAVCPCCSRIDHACLAIRAFGTEIEDYDRAFPGTLWVSKDEGTRVFGPQELCMGLESCKEAFRGFSLVGPTLDSSECDSEEFMDAQSVSCSEQSSKTVRPFASIGDELVTMEDLRSEDFERSWFGRQSKAISKLFRSFSPHTRMFSIAASAAVVAGAGFLTYEVVKLVCGLFKTMWDFVKGFFGASEIAEEQSNRTIKPKAVSYQHLRPRAQADQQSSAGPDLANNVYDNSYKLIVDTFDGGFMVFGQLIFLRGGTFVMPNHFLVNLRRMQDSGETAEMCKIKLRSCVHDELDIAAGMTVGDFLELPFFLMEERDLAFGVIKGVCPKSDVMKFLLKESELIDAANKAIRLDTARVDKNGLLTPWNQRLAFLDPHVQYGTHQLQCGPVRHKQWFKYSAATQVGDCGAPLCLQRAVSFQHRVWLGIHIGGREGWGYSSALSLELAEVALEALRNKDPHLKQYMIKNATPEETDEQCGIYSACDVKFTTINQFPFSDEPADSFGSFIALAKVNKPVSIPVRSKLVRTIAGVEQMFGETNLVPMKMGPYRKDGETVYPMVMALKPYSSEIVRIDEWWTVPGIRAGMKKFTEATRNTVGRVLTYEEAVIGNTALGLKAIPRNTSVGYPYCLKAKDKTYFWGTEDVYDLTNPRAKQLEREVHGLEQMVLRGERPYFLCRGFLKDETRKEGKDARYIAATPVHYYILCRKYFGVFVATQMHNHTEAGMCPGICEYKDWPWLRGWLTRPGGKCWDGDFKGFDSSQMPTFLGHLLDYINEWYTDRGATEEENMARSVLYQDLMFSRHLVGRGTQMDTVVAFSKSLPSGHFLTACVNSAQSMCAMSCSYLALTFRSDFWDQCATATLGDDNGNGASDEVIGEYNQVTVAGFLKEKFSMEYTSARKDGVLRPYYSIEECEFLKRTFNIVDGRETCPLALSSILHCMYWVRESKHARKEDIMMDMCETALGELSMHGPQVWSQWAPKVVRLMLDYGRAPQRATFSHNNYLEYMLSRTDSSWSGLQRRSLVGKNDDLTL